MRGLICGFTFEDIASQRGISLRTVMRDWEKARLILFKELSETLRRCGACDPWGLRFRFNNSP
jgi:hypothetical protein